MSPRTIDTMICRACGAEAFTWLARVFLCPVCGGSEYVYTMFAEESARRGGREGRREEGGEVQRSAGEGRRKRKRRLSDE
jgi:predicted RNA-binding Zn-ribbon protein involved in translation (DUF1610 family)